MTAIVSRKLAVALVVETVEGTPVAPTAGGQYVSINSGFSITGNRNSIDSEELKDSLASGASVSGSENPAMNLPTYLKHSGTEGAAPQLDEAYTALFGTEVIESTEYNTVASSTVSAVKVDTGEGAQFERGQGLLLKDGVNGRSIAVVHSVATDDLIPAFNLANAPAVGVELGKCVFYTPANSGHQTVSAWAYWGSSDLVELISGCRATSLSLNFAAEEAITAGLNFEGIKLFRNPLTSTASLKYLDFTDDQGAAEAVVEEKVWKSPHELAAALTTAMNAVTSETILVEYDNSTGKYTVSSSTSAVLELDWSSGTNTANTIGTVLGFSVGADDTGATTYTSDAAVSLANPVTPALDNSDFLVAKNLRLYIGNDAGDNTCVEANSLQLTLDTPKANKQSFCAETGISGSIVASRSGSMTVQVLVDKYDAERFYNFSENQTLRLQLNFGEKSGGNWVEGKCGYIYAPTAKMTANPDVSDLNGLLAVSFTLSTFADENNAGEIYLGFL